MKTSQKSQPAIIVRPGHAISTATIKGKNLESVKNQLIIILDNNLYMSNKKTGETIDIESRLPASGGVGDDEHYHIYAKGKINKVLAPNMIIFRACMQNWKRGKLKRE